MRYSVLSLATAALLAQEKETQVAKPLRAVMEESLEKQRESVRKQTRSAQPADPNWFTFPWTTDKFDYFIAQPPLPAATSSLEPLIRDAAARESLPETLLRSVIRTESAFNSSAVSSKGALGLMQLMPETAASFGVADPFDPAQNLNAGAKYLAQLLSRYNGNMKLALAAYNAGPSAVDKYNGVPPYTETVEYVGKILGSR